MNMEERRITPRYLANWDTRFLCDCRKHSQKIDIHEGIAHEISIYGVGLLSDHNICQQKNVALQLMIPALLNGAQKKIVRVVGRSLSTVVKNGNFYTVLEFLDFEEDDKTVLENDLSQRFSHPFFSRPTHYSD